MLHSSLPDDLTSSCRCLFSLLMRRCRCGNVTGARARYSAENRVPATARNKYSFTDFRTVRTDFLGRTLRGNVALHGLHQEFRHGEIALERMQLEPPAEFERDLETQRNAIAPTA